MCVEHETWATAEALSYEGACLQREWCAIVGLMKMTTMREAPMSPSSSPLLSGSPVLMACSHISPCHAEDDGRDAPLAT